jgi:hypothetical protein
MPWAHFGHLTRLPASSSRALNVDLQLPQVARIAIKNPKYQANASVRRRDRTNLVFQAAAIIPFRCYCERQDRSGNRFCWFGSFYSQFRVQIPTENDQIPTIGLRTVRDCVPETNPAK